MSILFTHIGELIGIAANETDKRAGSEMKNLPSIKGAYLLIADDLIVDFGPMEALGEIEADQRVDINGKMVLPAWCDSHSHLVYAGNRVQEFVDRIHGLSYEEIARRGGGILHSARSLQKMPEDQLFEESATRLETVMKMGTGALEIKSGYGLTTAAELKMLRVIKRLNETYPVSIKATFLGAHAIPAAFQGQKDAYLELVIKETLPQVAKEGLADYIDIFCEQGYFSVSDTFRLLEAAKAYGLVPKIHANQFHAIGGVAAAVQCQARSVDHLEVLTEEDIAVLKNSATMPVALPGCSYFLGIPYTPARKLIDAGLPLALATDYNPGSAPSGNMNFVVSTACIKMGMTPEEAINAATINGAYAMGLEKTHGSISRGKKANFIISDEHSHPGAIPYNFGAPQLSAVYIEGKYISPI
ncbi:MAG: imidazolonepropionase [Lutibacter sp.]|nr:imidazolonepropionase [Lutibacter sp.]